MLTDFAININIKMRRFYLDISKIICFNKFGLLYSTKTMTTSSLFILDSVSGFIVDLNFSMLIT